MRSWWIKIPVSFKRGDADADDVAHAVAHVDRLVGKWGGKGKGTIGRCVAYQTGGSHGVVGESHRCCYELWLPATLPDDTDPEVMSAHVDACFLYDDDERLVTGESEISAAPPHGRTFRNRRISEQSTAPHARCNDADGCIEPVPKGQRCR